MRIRAVVAIALLVLPAIASAQVRLPGTGRARPRPARPAELPPQPGAITRETAMRWYPIYSRLSFEAYPMVSYVQFPGFLGDGRQSSWSTFGSGSRIDFRFTHFVSATLDLTSSFAGGPAVANTAELGLRFRPERKEDRRLYPYVDVRGGYVNTYTRQQALDDFTGSPPLPGTLARSSNGFGVLAGAGAEIGLTQRFSLTTGALLTHHRMLTRGTPGSGIEARHHTMQTYRFTLALRYNPVRMVSRP